MPGPKEPRVTLERSEAEAAGLLIFTLPGVRESPDQKRMYEALGRGLVRWQGIETGLYLIAFYLMKTDHASCSLAFFQNRSAEKKRFFVERLIICNVDLPTQTNVWKPLSEEIKRAIKFRNALAHFEMFHLTDEEFAKISPKTAFRSVLSPHHLDRHAKRGDSIPALAVETIDHNAHELRIIAYRLVYFVLDHIQPTEPQTKSLPPNLQRWLDSFRKVGRPSGFG